MPQFWQVGCVEVASELAPEAVVGCDAIILNQIIVIFHLKDSEISEWLRVRDGKLGRDIDREG